MNASLVMLVFGACVLVFLSPHAAAQQTESPPAETAPDQERGDGEGWEPFQPSEYWWWSLVDSSSENSSPTDEPTTGEEAAQTQGDTTEQESRAGKGILRHAAHSRTAHHAKARAGSKARTLAKARTAAKKTARAVARSHGA